MAAKELVTTLIIHQGLKKCKFPRERVKIFRGPQVEDDHPLCRNRNLNIALKSLNNHYVHMDQLGMIQPTSISSHSTCKQLHRHNVPRYRSVCKNEILKECKTDGSGKSLSLLPRSSKLSRLILA